MLSYGEVWSFSCFSWKMFFLFRNVFITGSAGVGKSFLLNEILKSLKHLKVYVTASTGVAACNIRGTTFHRFVGGLSFPFSVQFLTFCLYLHGISFHRLSILSLKSMFESDG